MPEVVIPGARNLFIPRFPVPRRTDSRAGGPRFLGGRIPGLCFCPVSSPVPRAWSGIICF
jgi:hypothetical protein